MTYQATVVRVMIASPSDVQRERGLIEHAIHMWNAVHSPDQGLVLLPVRWETHAPPSMNARAQEVINRYIVRDCDLLVAAFWTRLGTPTGKALSGTVEEIQEHLKAGKPTMIYFSQAPVVPPDLLDSEQYAALRQFKTSCQEQGLIHEYDSPESFREVFSPHLAMTVLRHFGKGSTREPIPNAPHVDDAGGPDVVPPIPDRGESARPADNGAGLVAKRLSEQAKEWVGLLSTDSSGMLLAVETFGGFSISIGRHAPVDNARGREEARARATLRELVAAELVQDRGYKNEVFALTDLGYQVGEWLAGRSNAPSMTKES
jgi:hypothetical protein